MTNQKEVILEIVHDYAKTINRSKIEAILSFYTDDALFMPENYKTITVRKLKNKNFNEFLEKDDFSMEYSDVEVVVDREFAFVTAIAKTSTKNKKSEETVEKTSRDFFVFKKEENQWKIYRYIFNNLQTIVGQSL